MVEASLAEQIRAVEIYLGRPLPSRVTALFRKESPFASSLLPLVTGRENDRPEPSAPLGSQFLDSVARFASVLGHAKGNADLARLDADSVWPSGLLVLEDAGCAIYYAVDLDDPNLRVIRCEHLDQVEDPQVAAGPGVRLAYPEPICAPCSAAPFCRRSSKARGLAPDLSLFGPATRRRPPPNLALQLTVAVGRFAPSGARS